MESLLTLIENNSLLKKWINSCRLENKMHELKDKIKSDFQDETGAVVNLPSDLSAYGAEFLTLNENIKSLKDLRNEEQRLKNEIVKAEQELEQARKKRKNIIIASVAAVVVLIIVILFVV